MCLLLVAAVISNPPSSLLMNVSLIESDILARVVGQSL